MDLYSLLINGGVAGIFAIFAVVMFRNFTATLEKLSDQFAKSLHESRDDFLSFLKGEREQRLSVMNNATEKFDKLTATLLNDKLDKFIERMNEVR